MDSTSNSGKTARIVIWIMLTIIELIILYAWLMGKLNENKDGKWFIDILIFSTACGSLSFAIRTESLHKQWKTWKIIIVNTIRAAFPCLLCYGLAYATKDIGSIPIFAWLFMIIAFLCTPLVAVVPINTIICRIHYLYCIKKEVELDKIEANHVKNED